MKWKDPVARLYARISAVDPTDDGEARPNHSPLWIGTAVALSACFAVALACGPASNDDAIVPITRSSRVEGAGCDVGDGGIQVADDDTCTVGTGTTGASASAASTGSSTGSTGSGSTGTTTAALPPEPDAGVLPG